MFFGVVNFKAATVCKTPLEGGRSGDAAVVELLGC